MEDIGRQATQIPLPSGRTSSSGYYISIIDQVMEYFSASVLQNSTN